MVTALASLSADVLPRIPCPLALSLAFPLALLVAACSQPEPSGAAEDGQAAETAAAEAPRRSLSREGSDWDPVRVDSFLAEYTASTLATRFDERCRKLDERIARTALSLGDKVAAWRRLSPRATDGTATDGVTLGGTELRMERLLLSIDPLQLTIWKAQLEYDGDYKDLEEYLFHDIDDQERRHRILGHLAEAPAAGIKVLTDADDTLFANLVDDRYPQRVPYPGVLAFYEALAVEPFALSGVPVTILSARPDPLAGLLEEDSLAGLARLTSGRLYPSGLSGSLTSSALGTVETLLRAKLEPLSGDLPDGQERRIGVVKFSSFSRFARIYPEYDFVFVGDSGQADALTALLMISDESDEGAARIVTTFIHDLRESDNDRRRASPAFRGLPSGVLVDASSTSGRGVIVFRNYVDAAIQAHLHAPTLDDLITAEELAAVTRAGLEEFHQLDFGERKTSRRKLTREYREDGEKALELLTAVRPATDRLEDEAGEIRRLLDQFSPG